MQQHQQRQQASKQAARDWLKDLIASHEPPPAPDIVREQLKQYDERARRQVLS